MESLESTFTVQKEAWVEPSIEQLHVSETAAKTGTGGDGDTAYPDCTKS